MTLPGEVTPGKTACRNLATALTQTDKICYLRAPKRISELNLKTFFTAYARFF